MIPGYATAMTKSQDITIGSAKPITKCRLKLQAETKMESLNLGMTYVALSHRLDSCRIIVVNIYRLLPL